MHCFNFLKEQKSSKGLQNFELSPDVIIVATRAVQINEKRMEDYKGADDDLEDDDDELAPLVIETPSTNSPQPSEGPAFPVPMEIGGDIDDDEDTSATETTTTPKPMVKPIRQPSPNKSRKKGDKIQPVGIAPDGSVHFKCPVCSMVLQSQHDLTKHIRTHNTIAASPGSSNTCTICGKVLSSQSSLDRHMLVHSGERPFQCKYCSMAFTTNGNMHRHMRIHAKEGTATTSAVKKAKRKSEPQELSAVTVKKQPKVNQTLPPSQEKPIPSKMTPNVANECPVQECGRKAFLTAYGLDAHMKTCHSNLILQCPVCFVPCSSRRVLFQHVSTTHGTLPKKKIEQDGTREEVLSFHELSFFDFTHSKFPLIAKVWCDKNKLVEKDDSEKRFECSVCDSQFPSEDTLRIHKNWHALEGQMASRCVECDVDFEEASELDEHEIRHVKDAVLKRAEVKHDIREDVSREEFLAAFDLKVNKENQNEKQLQQASYINRLQKLFESPTQPVKSELHPAFGSPPFPAVSLLSDVAKKFEYPFPQGSPSPVKDETPRPYTKHGVLVKDEIETAISCFSPTHLTHPNSANTLPQITTPNSKSSVRFECRLCNAYYDRRADCVRHVTQQHSNVPCEIIDTQIAQVPVTQQETPIDLSVRRNRKNSSPVRSGTNLTHFCEICRAGFTDVEDLQRHVQAKHEDKEILMSAFVKEKLRERLEVNNNTEFFMRTKKNSYSDSPHKHVCPHCFRAFPWESSLKRHVLTHTGQKPFKCPCCSVYFSTKSNRERHVARKHGLDVQDRVTKMLMELAHACSYCTRSPQRFATSEQLIAHHTLYHADKPLPEEAQARSYQDEDDDADVSSRSTSPEAASTSAECGKCGVVLPSRNLLTRHNREEHRSEVAFRCHLCDASFQDRRACAEHVVAKHPEVWNAVSEKNGYDDVQALCDSVDATSGNHRDDYDEKRIQAAKVACFACRKRFGSLQDLRRHMATHTGERAFVCPLCAKRFSFKHSLRRHMRRHEINEASDSNPASPAPEMAKA
ncbi:DgyrCDS6759 [Dimorphilus gyrociliatus]|uniref:DgyrCDS6759 n=1 Tax=Dimorphilus gyrociliatus TaxID=2664684 RepID=A0A7I8VQK4_9ANNE|nr:DgyrCDS6759 [Dimorphilus gyrociliatus]